MAPPIIPPPMPLKTRTAVLSPSDMLAQPVDAMEAAMSAAMVRNLFMICLIGEGHSHAAVCSGDLLRDMYGRVSFCRRA